MLARQSLAKGAEARASVVNSSIEPCFVSCPSEVFCDLPVPDSDAMFKSQMPTSNINALIQRRFSVLLIYIWRIRMLVYM